MNIFITGAAGFIGSNLVKFYLDRGDKVIALDNLSLGKKENIDPFLSHPNFEFEKADLLDCPKLQEMVSWADRVYHMAAIVGQKFVIAHPVDVISNNIHITERILQMAASAEKEVRVLVASSSCVYDRLPPNQPKEESSNLLMASGKFIQETYPLSKVVNEVMSLSQEFSHKVHTVIARIFNVIGPNQTGRYGMVVPSFINQALAGDPITVYGDGSQTRSFCYVQDVVNMLHALMETKEAKGQIVNVGNTEEVSILALANLVKAKTSSSSKIVQIPYKEAYQMDFEDVKRRSPIIDKLQELIGEVTFSSLEETIEKIIEAKKAN